MSSQPTNMQAVAALDQRGSAVPQPSVAPQASDQAGSGSNKVTNEGNAFASGNGGPTLPPVSLPSGGGAIRGMGESISIDAAHGTANLSVPVELSASRNGAAPALNLQYSSGAGGSVFGLGWSLEGIPTVTRQTRNGVPRYTDDDVFVVSGAGDCVPVYEKDESGAFVVVDRQSSNATTFKIAEKQLDGYLVRQYRPRVEGMFARIERWTDQLDPEDTHWRIYSSSNDLTILGRNDDSRLSALVSGRKVTFSWLGCEWYNCLGDARLFKYKRENNDNVDVAKAHERNRTADVRGSQLHLKRVLYGNRGPVVDRQSITSVPAADASMNWMFEVVFDYGEHDWITPEPQESPQQLWLCRADPFSTFSSGFEIRTYRLCKRVLMFHHFPAAGDLGRQDYLVSALEIEYKDDPAVTCLKSLRRAYYVLRQPNDPPVIAGQDSNLYFTKRLPPLQIEYSSAPSDADFKRMVVQDIDGDTGLEDLPVGVQGSYQWLDLLGEGMTGILTTDNNAAWYYKPNLSPTNHEPITAGTVEDTQDLQPSPRKPKFGSMQIVGSRPILPLANASAEFLDLGGDHSLSYTVKDGTAPGFFRHTSDTATTVFSASDSWSVYNPFPSWPNIDMNDPNLRFLDLTGNGQADILITHDDVFVWYEGLGESGFATAGTTLALALEEEDGPRVLFSDVNESIHLADFSGDGLIDLVRVRNGDICYWPNLGYGRFGTKVMMDNAPSFDASGVFSSRRLILGDIDGSGTTDLIYFGASGAQIYLNLAGNSWTDMVHVDSWPTLDVYTTVAAVDLLGCGTMCLVWSSAHPSQQARSMRYIDLSGGQKAHLLTRVVTNMGCESQLLYRPSTAFYLDDMANGKPWATRLPFPQHCVERLVVRDRVSGNASVQRYAYHHGYFDTVEREFRGFGMVEQWDAEEVATSNEPSSNDAEKAGLKVPPTCTRSWFHTGAFDDHERLSKAFAKDYYGAPSSNSAQYETELDIFFQQQLRDDLSFETSTLTLDEMREASRALVGSALRTEVYADDGGEKAAIPYQITDIGSTVRMLQPRGSSNPYAVFHAFPRETLTHHFEREVHDPRVEHLAVLKVDDFGNDLETVNISYGRKSNTNTAATNAATLQRQQQQLIVHSMTDFTNAVLGSYDYRLPQVCRKRSWEVAQTTTPINEATGIYSMDQLGQIRDIEEVPFEQPAEPASQKRRLIEHVETVYQADELQGLLAVGQLEPLGLPGVTYRLCLTSSMISNAFLRGEEVLLPDPKSALAAVLTGYTNRGSENQWWIPSSRVYYHPDRTVDTSQELAMARKSFFTPHRVQDAFGAEAIMNSDPHFLFHNRVEDSLGNITISKADYRVLKPYETIDPNGNTSLVSHDATGLPVGMAEMGKEAQLTGDTLADFKPNLSRDELRAYLANPEVNAAGLLAGATSRYVHDYDAYWEGGDQSPVWTSTIAREEHRIHEPTAPSIGDTAKVQISFAYIDGYQRTIQAKARAEGSPSGPDVPRWRTTGWTVFNNKSLPVLKFEPSFEETHLFEFDKRKGVSTVLFYDALHRPIGTLFPNKTWSKQIYGSWVFTEWDTNDTVAMPLLQDPNLGAVAASLPREKLEPSWLDARRDGQLGLQEKKAALKALAHANTPTVSYCDALGRLIIKVVDNGSGGKISTSLNYDIHGNVLETTNGLGRVVTLSVYDMCGNLIRNQSADFGTRWQLVDAAAEPCQTWDSRGFYTRTEHDPLRRPTAVFVRRAEGEAMMRKYVYGEAQVDAATHNLRGRLFREYDQAGIVTHNEYDFKGNVLVSSRQFAAEYKSTITWANEPAVQMLPDIHKTARTFDALNRTTTVTSPDDSIVTYKFNEGGLLHAVSARLKGKTATTIFVSSTEYDAYDRVVVQIRGNGTTTTTSYDALTQYMVNKKTRNGSREVQDLSYCYDAAGNVTSVENNAEQTVFFCNTAVAPHSEYTYDAIYRLIEATGRENIGQTKGAPSGPTALSSQTASSSATALPADGSAMARYVEQYTYDSAGRMTKMQHQIADTQHPGWTRSFTYGTTGDSSANNHLVSTSIGSSSETYTWDAHGNMTSMPHLAKIQWDYENRMHSSSSQRRTNGTPETTWYVYDGSGHRVRKITDRQAPAGVEHPSKLSETFIVDGFEIHRQYSGDGVGIVQQCDTLHIARPDGEIALVEDWSGGTTGNFRLYRYQLRDRAGSIDVELDESGRPITFEEYSPYGSSVSQSDISKSPKRYRYAGKERDTENGFYYSEQRYYVPWLARWLNPDPMGVADGLNVFEYVGSNPLRFSDPSGLGRIPMNVGRTVGTVVRRSTVAGAAISGPRASGFRGLHQSSRVFQPPSSTLLLPAPPQRLLLPAPPTRLLLPAPPTRLAIAAPPAQNALVKSGAAESAVGALTTTRSRSWSETGAQRLIGGWNKAMTEHPQAVGVGVAVVNQVVLPFIPDVIKAWAAPKILGGIERVANTSAPEGAGTNKAEEAGDAINGQKFAPFSPVAEKANNQAKLVMDTATLLGTGWFDPLGNIGTVRSIAQNPEAQRLWQKAKEGTTTLLYGENGKKKDE